MAEKHKNHSHYGHGNICPECHTELQAAAFPYCPSCGIHYINCPSCNVNYSRDLDYCPECGAEARKPMKGI